MIFDKTLWQPNDRKKEGLVPRGRSEGVHRANYLLGKPFSFLDVLMRLVSAAVHGPAHRTRQDRDYNRIHFLRSKHRDLEMTQAGCCWASRPSNGITLVDPN